MIFLIASQFEAIALGQNVNLLVFWRSAAKPNLVSIRITIGCFTHMIQAGFHFGGVESAICATSLSRS
jgi:hypothetical protein